MTDLKINTDEVGPVMVWVDMETTGLDEHIDLPLELGIKVTDRNLRVLAENSWLIRTFGWLDALKDNPVALEMHEKSGLVDELNALPENWRYRETIMSYGCNSISLVAYKWLAEDLGLDLIDYPMCGSSVHFDRKFTSKYLPVFDGFFGYRHIDVSTLKEISKVVAPHLHREMKNDPRFDKKNAKHRVLADLDATLAEFKVYLNRFIVSEAEVA